MSEARTRPKKLTDMAAMKGVTVKQMVKDALESEKSILGAAKLLGCAPTSIQHHMRRYRMTLLESRTVQVVEE
jgi:transcriptional regulator with GAF, ATPase, and Fis domain